MADQTLVRRIIALASLLALHSSCSSGSAPPEDDEKPESSATADDDSDDDAPPSNTKRDSGPSKQDAGATKSDAGSKSDASAPSKITKALPCEVQTIVTKACAECHGAKTNYGAPMSLVSADDFQLNGEDGSSMLDLVKQRINQSDPRKAMPPTTGVKLSKEELATLNAWLDKKAPAGDKASCGSEPPTQPEKPDEPAIDTSELDCYKFASYGSDKNTKFKVGSATDAYYNFTFAAPWKGEAYAVLFRPVIDNSQVLHHMLLFQNLTPGGDTGAVPSIGAHPEGQLIYGWAPGGQPLDFRDSGDVGFDLPDTISYTMEYHYNSKDPNAVDSSGIEVCVARRKPANIAGISWLGYDQLGIPATKWSGTCVPFSSEPITIIGVQPHMHVTGTHMKTIINRKDGTKETLHDEPFDFNDQRNYLKNVVINPGDTLSTECTFSKPMAFGEGTGQEMCYNFTVAYPKGALKDLGPWGSVAHGGSACLGQ